MNAKKMLEKIKKLFLCKGRPIVWTIPYFLGSSLELLFLAKRPQMKGCPPLHGLASQYIVI
jgi:hypothetical protein